MTRLLVAALAESPLNEEERDMSVPALCAANPTLLNSSRRDGEICRSMRSAIA
jgi:hypothetical protein